MQAMMITFDPVDLVHVTAGFAKAHGADAVTIDHAAYLQTIAEALAEMWGEFGRLYDGVWAYDVAAGVGEALRPQVVAASAEHHPTLTHADIRVLAKRATWRIIRESVTHEALRQSAGVLNSIMSLRERERTQLVDLLRRGNKQEDDYHAATSP